MLIATQESLSQLLHQSREFLDVNSTESVYAPPLGVQLYIGEWQAGTVKLLLSQGASATYVDKGATYLHLAIKGSCAASLEEIEQVLCMLLERNANPLAENGIGVTVSHIACCRNSSFGCKSFLNEKRCTYREGYHNSRLNLRGIWASALTKAGYNAEQVIESSVEGQTCMPRMGHGSHRCPACVQEILDNRTYRSRLKDCRRCRLLYRNRKELDPSFTDTNEVDLESLSDEDSQSSDSDLGNLASDEIDAPMGYCDSASSESGGRDGEVLESPSPSGETIEYSMAYPPYYSSNGSLQQMMGNDALLPTHSSSLTSFFEPPGFTSVNLSNNAQRQQSVVYDTQSFMLNTPLDNGNRPSAYTSPNPWLDGSTHRETAHSIHHSGYPSPLDINFELPALHLPTPWPRDFHNPPAEDWRTLEDESRVWELQGGEIDLGITSQLLPDYLMSPFQPAEPGTRVRFYDPCRE